MISFAKTSLERVKNHGFVKEKTTFSIKNKDKDKNAHGFVKELKIFSQKVGKYGNILRSKFCLLIFYFFEKTKKVQKLRRSSRFLLSLECKKNFRLKIKNV